jgi:hypothetical protein
MTPFLTSLAALVLLGHLKSSIAFTCGRPLTTACLGDTDIRYDPDVSNAIVDQAEVWKKTAGYFTSVGTVQSIIPGTEELSAPLNLKGFGNYSIVGSRLYLHIINLYSGVAGITKIDFYATSTHEKDGRLLVLDSANQLGVDVGVDGIIPETDFARASFYITPVDGNSRFSSISGLSSRSDFFLDEGYTTFAAHAEQFFNFNGTILRSFSDEVHTRVTEEEWIAAVNNAYNEGNHSNRIPIPMLGECLGEKCKTENDWCTQDPECSPSPYKEPEAQVKPGVIAAVALAGILILTAGLYLFHLYLASKQAKRYRTIFAARIADTIQVRKSMRSLTPEILAKEFKNIDSQTQDGQITKEELWEFLSSGKAGELNQSDFNALFAAIDTDKSGHVDFLEFCTFMGQCHEEYTAARKSTGGNRLSAIDRTSRRISVAESAAHRLSSAVPAGQDMAKAVAELEEATKDPSNPGGENDY